MLSERRAPSVKTGRFYQDQRAAVGPTPGSDQGCGTENVSEVSGGNTSQIKQVFRAYNY